MANAITRSCFICRSQYAREIRDAYDQGVVAPQIFKKYQSLLDYKAKLASFYQMLWRCKHDNHKLPELPSVMGDGTFEDYAQKLMAAGMNPDMFTGKKISHNAIIAAQRALIEKEKAKVQNDAMKIAMIAFFRGNGARLPEGVVIDAELIPSNTE